MSLSGSSLSRCSSCAMSRLETAAPGDARAYRRDRAPPLEISPYLFRLLLQTLGETRDLGVDLVVGRFDPLLRNDGTQREVSAHAGNGALAQRADEGVLLLAGRGEILLDG